MADQKVIGIFASQDEAIAAIKRLQIDGYKDDKISVLSKKREDIDKVKKDTDIKTETESPVEGAAGGAVVGGAAVGAGALLAQLGLIAIPGIGPILAAGPIAAALAGLVAGGAVGGVAGALVDMGISKEKADEYEEYLERGDILVMVEDTDVPRNPPRPTKNEDPRSPLV